MNLKWPNTISSMIWKGEKRVARLNICDGWYFAMYVRMDTYSNIQIPFLYLYWHIPRSIEFNRSLLGSITPLFYEQHLDLCWTYWSTAQSVLRKSWA